MFYAQHAWARLINVSKVFIGDIGGGEEHNLTPILKVSDVIIGISANRMICTRKLTSTAWGFRTDYRGRIWKRKLVRLQLLMR